jgi:hypothetical protein
VNISKLAMPAVFLSGGVEYSDRSASSFVDVACVSGSTNVREALFGSLLNTRVIMEHVVARGIMITTT